MPALLQRLDRFPPCVCRVLARDESGRPLTSRAIAIAAGLNRTQVDRIAQLTSWATVEIRTADKYLYGCRINPYQMRRHAQFRKRLRSAATHRITKSRNASYFQRLDQIVGAKAKAKAQAAFGKEK